MMCLSTGSLTTGTMICLLQTLKSVKMEENLENKLSLKKFSKTIMVSCIESILLFLNKYFKGDSPNSTTIGYGAFRDDVYAES